MPISPIILGLKQERWRRRGILVYWKLVKEKKRGWGILGKYSFDLKVKDEE